MCSVVTCTYMNLQLWGHQAHLAAAQQLISVQGSPAEQLIHWQLGGEPSRTADWWPGPAPGSQRWGSSGYKADICGFTGLYFLQPLDKNLRVTYLVQMPALAY